MFETEAGFAETKMLIKCNGDYTKKQDYKKGWQDGAEFGYNKAMEEWKKHFMQCSSPFCLDKFSEVKCYGELGNMAKKKGDKNA
jgi:hypothetical protein